MTKIIIDFDDTLVISNYPAIGEPVPGSLETIYELQERHKIILNTMRADMNNGTKEHAIKWLANNKVNLSGCYNKKRMPERWIKNKFIPISYYLVLPEIFIDDIAEEMPLITIGKNRCVNWEVVREHLKEAGLL
jgi:hypothetical protein